METKQEYNILQAIANDLSLLKELTQGTFKITKEDFSKENQQTFEALNQLRNMNFKSANTESLSLVNSEFMVMDLDERQAKTQFKNELAKYEKAQAQKEINKTIKKIEDTQKELANEKDIFKKEDLLKQIGKLSQEHKTLIRKNNSRTTLEITRGLQYDENRGVIPTFIPAIDNEINGGFERYNINVISATPHNGKTTLGVEAASNQAMNDYRVLYLSLEQIAENINQSVLGFVSETVLNLDEKTKKRIFGTQNPKGEYDKPYWDYTKFKDWKDTNEKKKLGEKILSETVMDYLTIDDDDFKDVHEVLGRIQYASEEGFDVVYIDNFQNLKYTGDRTQAFEKFSEGLLEIAKTTGLAIVALSQLTADGKGNVKTKYASKLNDDASNHLKITRVKKEEDEAETPDMVEVYVEKTRRGRGFDAKIMLPFLGAKGIIGSIHIPKRSESENQKRKEAFTLRQMAGGFKAVEEPEQQEGLPF